MLRIILGSRLTLFSASVISICLLSTVLRAPSKTVDCFFSIIYQTELFWQGLANHLVSLWIMRHCLFPNRRFIFTHSLDPSDTRHRCISHCGQYSGKSYPGVGILLPPAPPGSATAMVGKSWPFPMTQFPYITRKSDQSSDLPSFAATMGFLLGSYRELEIINSWHGKKEW